MGEEVKQNERIAVPIHFRNCRLMRERRGFSVSSDIIEESDWRRLCSEALLQELDLRKEFRGRRILPASLNPTFSEDRRAGARIKRFLARGGEAQYGLFHCSTLLDRLSAEVGLAVKPSGSHGIYAYYICGGDFIGVHRDTHPLDVELITCLFDTHPEYEAGSLGIYAGRTTESCASISKNIRRGQELVKLLPGQSLLLLGGVLPHRVLPVLPDQLRIVSSLSFSIASNTALPDQWPRSWNVDCL